MKNKLNQHRDIKTVGDIDAYRYSHPVNGVIESRYHTIVKLYSTNDADRIMRGLEVQSWKML